MALNNLAPLSFGSVTRKQVTYWESGHTLNLVPPPAPRCIRPEGIVGLFVSQNSFSCRGAHGCSFTSLPKDKKTHDAIWQSRGLLTALGSSLQSRWALFRIFATLWWPVWENPVYFVGLALWADVYLTVTTCIFFSFRIHMETHLH